MQINEFEVCNTDEYKSSLSRIKFENALFEISMIIIESIGKELYSS